MWLAGKVSAPGSGDSSAGADAGVLSISLTDRQTPLSPVSQPQTYGGCKLTQVRRGWRLTEPYLAHCADRFFFFPMCMCVRVPRLRIAFQTRTRSENGSAAVVDHADNSAHRFWCLSGSQLTSADGCEVRRRCLSLKSRSDPSQRVSQTFIRRANVWPASGLNLSAPTYFRDQALSAEATAGSSDGPYPTRWAEEEGIRCHLTQRS